MNPAVQDTKMLVTCSCLSEPAEALGEKVPIFHYLGTSFLLFSARAF